MALAYNKFFDFVEQLGLIEHQLNTDTHRVALSNTAPAQTNTILANITQIASGNGYTTNGEDAQNTWAESSGTATLTASQIVWTGGASAMAAFRYAVYYSNATRGLVNPLIAWWDYGSAITLQPGETATWKPNSASSGTVFTLA